MFGINIWDRIRVRDKFGIMVGLVLIVTLGLGLGLGLQL